MKKLTILLFTLCLYGFGAQVKLARHPSYYKGKVAFSYLGDIWVANEDGSNPQRLTVHKAREVYPRFSPDGKWIAYSSNRQGNYDVYVMPASGGASRQLTFNSSAETVVGWTADSRRVVFVTSRGRLFTGVPNLYEVPLEGGMEQVIPTDWGSWGSYSPDGKKLAFNRHSPTWWRKHYRGAYSADLWLMDVAAKKFTRIGDDEYKGNLFWPMYGAKGEIYFVADRLPNEKAVRPGSPEVMRSVNNIRKISERGGRPSQVTHHTSGNLFFPSISADGRVIVYEENFGIWKLDTATGKSTEIRLDIASDDKDNNVEMLNIASQADSFNLSPSSRRAAIATHGEIFTVATDRGDPQRVTNSPSRETGPEWSPDGKWIAFYSDRSGREEIWIASERGQNQKKVSDSDTEKTALAWAPDSKSFLYSGSDHKLYRVYLDNGKTEALAAGEVSDIRTPRFSPDGAWISYSTMDRTNRPHVYVIPAAGGPARHIERDDLASETNAQWTPDGTRLVFLGGFAQSSMASTSGRNVNMQLYAVRLRNQEKNPLERGIDSEEEAAAQGAGARGMGGMSGPGMGRAPRVEVKIDWDGIDRRVRQITRLGDPIGSLAVSPDARLFAFTVFGSDENRPFSALYTVQSDGDRLTRVATSAQQAEGDEAPPSRGSFGGAIVSPQFSRDARTLYYLEGSSIYAVEIGGAASSGTASRGSASSTTTTARRRVSFSVRVEVDHRAEWKQAFNESWRTMKYRFYDGKMHGVDWNQVKDTYGPLMDYVNDQEEMHDLVQRIVGELNASHMGISGSGSGRQAETRYPGFEVEPDAAGYYKVTHIYKNGPADHDFIRIRPGNFILAVGDQELKAGDDYWKLYSLASGRRMEFTVNSRPARAGAWKVKVETVSGTIQGNFQYERWVADRKTMVDKLSGGEIGYLHIRSMDAPSLRRFERDLVENQTRKALIIDERFNGGGGIDQELTQLLGQREYQVTQGRDSVRMPRPLRGFYGPMAVLQNERSASDAEMFPDAFRRLGLGKLVGVTTLGAVIGTGSHRLIDGSMLRTPGAGVWSVEGYNLENYGVRPDVYIDNTPDDFLAGRDAQLEKAVEVLRTEMKKKP